MPLRKYGLISLVEKTKTKNFLDPSWLHSSWKENLYIHPLLFISFHSPLNLFYSGFCLRHFTETLVQVTSNLLVAKSNDQFQLPSYLTYQQHLTRLIIPASLKHCVSLVTTISQFSPYGPFLSHLSRISRSPNVAVAPGSPFFYLLSFRWWSQILTEF